jgi:hypothetical protein
MIKVNRKPNGEVLGIPIFLGANEISGFVNQNSTHVEVKKTLKTNGVFLEFEPIKAINEDKKGLSEPVKSG